MNKRTKKVAQPVIDRLLTLSNYLNQIKAGKTTRQDWEICDDLGYTNRKQLHRDLKRLADGNYISMDVSVVPTVAPGLKHAIKKRRVIGFLPSEHGLMTMPVPRKPGDILGKAVYKGREILYIAENMNNGKWMKGPDHTLILNPDYTEY